MNEWMTDGNETKRKRLNQWHGWNQKERHQRSEWNQINEWRSELLGLLDEVTWVSAWMDTRNTGRKDGYNEIMNESNVMTCHEQRKKRHWPTMK